MPHAPQRHAAIAVPLVLLLAAAGPGAAGGATRAGHDAELWGDLWEVHLVAAYTLPDGSAAELAASYTIWSPWPIPYEGFEDRVRGLAITVDVPPRYSDWQANPEARFYFLHAGAIGVQTLSFGVEFLAQDLVWPTQWTWEFYDACSTGNMVLGDLEDAFGTGTFQGEPLSAPATLPGPNGPITINGAGFARRIGPGDDGWYECYEGNVHL